MSRAPKATFCDRSTRPFSLMGSHRAHPAQECIRTVRPLSMGSILRPVSLRRVTWPPVLATPASPPSWLSLARIATVPLDLQEEVMIDYLSAMFLIIIGACLPTIAYLLPQDPAVLRLTSRVSRRRRHRQLRRSYGNKQTKLQPNLGRRRPRCDRTRPEPLHRAMTRST